MNCVTLVGRVIGDPVFYCTPGAMDLCRFVLRTEYVGLSGRQSRQSHHCVAWGPAAHCLHEHLGEGNQLLVQGTIRYRSNGRPQIQVIGYSYLDGSYPAGAATARASVGKAAHSVR